MTCTCTFHCASCAGHFHSLEAFDLHRAGDHATRRFCLDPDACERLTVATTEGVCRLDHGVAALRGVTIYRSRRHAEDENAVLRLRSAERWTKGFGGDRDPAEAAAGDAHALAEVAT